MTEVLRSPSHLPSSPSPSLSCNPNDGSATHLSNRDLDRAGGEEGPREERKSWRRRRVVVVEEEEEEEEEEGEEEEEERKRKEQLSVLALLLTLFRKSLVGCKTEGEEELRSMEIGWPTDVRHVAHVTFDRFHGFLGLPVEFEPEVPRRAPSASATVFGVSTESMQLSYDSRGNSIPTILLLMQRRLYEQGGLRAEGIFRINAENSQEEYVRDQLNNGLVPDGVDVHCLAGLIKAWFRELPSGVLDSIPPEQVMQCQSEDDCAHLAKLLPSTEAALLDWAINLMADVVQEEQINKMNARNIAMVFAPNMTQMVDPLTALMYAVQVMNFLKMLILRTLKGRQEPSLEDASSHSIDPSDENGHQNPQLLIEACGEEGPEHKFLPKDPILDSPTHDETSTNDEPAYGSLASHKKGASVDFTGEPSSEIPAHTDGSISGPETAANGSITTPTRTNSRRNKTIRFPSHKRGARKAKGQSTIRAALPADKSRGTSIVSRINSKSERIEAWR